MHIDSVWAPVVAALGASLLTILGTLWLNRRQHRRAGKDAARQERFAAYQELLNWSFALANRIRAAGDTMRLRTGLGEGVQVLLRQRKPLDLMELYDWFELDFRGMRDAWSCIWTTGTQAAIDSADRLVDATVDLMSVATASPQRCWVVKVYGSLVGESWSKEQLEAYDTAARRFVDERVQFAQLVRTETGREKVEMTFERARREAPSESTQRKANAKE
jgi:hypothetical protein